MARREKRLSQPECETVLNDNIIGTISLVDGDRPYAVQLEYLYRDGALYMGSYLTGRKIDCMEKNSRAVFTVFEDRHGHPDLINRGIPCRSVMVEGRIGTIHKKDFTNREGVPKTYRLLRFDIEEMGSWQCSRKVCNLVAGLDAKKMLADWVAEAANEGLDRPGDALLRVPQRHLPAGRCRDAAKLQAQGSKDS